MKTQTYQNHRRFVPFFHFFLFGLLMVLLLLSLAQLLDAMADEENELLSLLVTGTLVALIFLFFFTRIFALKAQDRAIRAEENLRHFALAGKFLDQKLSIEQITALRFAPDEELPELAGRAAEHNLSPSAIKQEIKKWRADHHRV